MMPTVTTAAAVGSMLRERIVCSDCTASAAITTGSTASCGYAPCACLPVITARQLSLAACIGPAPKATVPTSNSCPSAAS